MNQSEGATRPVPSAQRTPASRCSHHLRPLSRRDLLYRLSAAKRANSIRIRMSKRQHQSMLPGHWPDVRPASLPVSRRSKAPTPQLPRSLPSLGWVRNPSFRIRLDPSKGTSFPFPHSPPGSPPQIRLGPLRPDRDKCLSTPLNARSYGSTPSSYLADPPTSPRTDQATHADHTPYPPGRSKDLGSSPSSLKRQGPTALHWSISSKC